MDIYGMDFTSNPGRTKPITRQHCRLDGDVLRALASSALTTFDQFEEALSLPGPWIAGIDFPFGQVAQMEGLYRLFGNRKISPANTKRFKLPFRRQALALVLAD